jgi:hypothetical protein
MKILRRIAGIGIASVIAGLSTCHSAALAADIQIGMNYNWWRWIPRTEAECRAHPALAFRGNWLLYQYEDPKVRKAVIQQLHEMRQAGFTLLKILVYHRRPGLDHNPEYFYSQDGSLSAPDKAKLQNFVSDIAAAAFKSLEVGMGIPDQNAPFCRRRVWGDCFQPQRTDENWRFISDVTKAVTQMSNGLSLVFDLSDEGACPAANMEPRTLLNTNRYVQTIARRWQDQFGSNWVISCPNSPRAARLDLLVSYLGEAGLSPKYLEIHNYETDPTSINPTLDEVQRIATQLGAQAILGETQYNNSEKAAILANWLQRHHDSRFSAMIMWPVQGGSKRGCPQMDTPPPYVPGPLSIVRAQ